MGAVGSMGAKTQWLLTPRTADTSELVIGLLIKAHQGDIMVQLAALPLTPGSRGAICDQNCPNQLTFPGITQCSGQSAVCKSKARPQPATGPGPRK